MITSQAHLQQTRINQRAIAAGASAAVVLWATVTSAQTSSNFANRHSETAGSDFRIVRSNLKSARAELEALAAQWKRETGHLSSISEMVLHPSYQRIIGKGPRAISFLLSELQNEPDHWFWALTAITGVDPIPDRSRGNLEEMTAAWIAWGKQHGLC